MPKTKAVILTEIISPYRIPPFNYLAQDEEIDLTVFFFAETESRRSWLVEKEKIQFSYQVLWGLQLGKSYQSAPVFLNPDVIYQLWKQQPDVIICGGWHHFTHWLALMYAQMTKTPLLIWSESTLKDERILSSIKYKLKEWIVNQADGYIIPGKAQKNYLAELGAREDRIWTAPNAVDSVFFANEAQYYRQQKAILKEKLDIAGCVILYVGRLIDEKGIPELLEAFTKLSPQKQVTLVIVGDGSRSQNYHSYTQQNQLDNVVFAGFQPQTALPQYYGIADIFVFPTRSDTWGLVLNEAMAAGLPIVCSDAAGAAPDLVVNGENGYLIPVGDVEKLSEKLQILVEDENLREKMGLHSQEIIANYTPQKMALGLKEAILGSLQHNRITSQPRS
ncbi:glycosyltransferase family 4 protein [Rivularia sp. UHCC 0363]|uniref:glycosyltransferase family 4 protein n=1 Tax=Rivularia sp. UHCC 0363 TaxID=3110244 RepID=UPI002B1EB27E|nr:glycosyltransferase family 4 protein [Rivularia sp. UHCC 0363]MEA5593444.1 glycosyltransferase family 4 protein [Rivularia sp. UHCC 0363]